MPAAPTEFTKNSCEGHEIAAFIFYDNTVARLQTRYLPFLPLLLQHTQTSPPANRLGGLSVAAGRRTLRRCVGPGPLAGSSSGISAPFQVRGVGRNPPATGLRPAALPPLTRGAFGAEMNRAASSLPCQREGDRRRRRWWRDSVGAAPLGGPPVRFRTPRLLRTFCLWQNTILSPPIGGQLLSKGAFLPLRRDGGCGVRAAEGGRPYGIRTPVWGAPSCVGRDGPYPFWPSAISP